MVFLTLTPMNKPVKFGLKAKTYFYFYFFRNKKKRKDKYVLHTIFVFHNKNLQPKYIIRSTKKGTGDQQQKKGTGDQQINKKGSLIFFLQNFLISKKTLFG